MEPTLLAVDRLAVDYKKPGLRSRAHRVIHDVSFTVAQGETLALVGESGSGKSTIGKAILGLVPCAAGSIQYQGQELERPRQEGPAGPGRGAAGDLPKPVRIAQPRPDHRPDPVRAAHRLRQVHPAVRNARIAELLERVNMPSDTVTRFPGNFSGGQRQRIAIARALALDPSLVICDEPTSALDVSTQASVLELLAEIQDRTGVSYLFITHDLAVVREFAHRAIVLEQGTIVEEGPARHCATPRSTRTRGSSWPPPPCRIPGSNASAGNSATNRGSWSTRRRPRSTDRRALLANGHPEPWAWPRAPVPAG